MGQMSGGGAPSGAGGDAGGSNPWLKLLGGGLKGFSGYEQQNQQLRQPNGNQVQMSAPQQPQVNLPTQGVQMGPQKAQNPFFYGYGQ